MPISRRKTNTKRNRECNAPENITKKCDTGFETTPSEEMDTRCFLNLSDGEDSGEHQCPTVLGENEPLSPTFTQQEYYSEREPTSDCQNIWYENTLISNEELPQKLFTDFQQYKTEMAKVKAYVLEYTATRTEAKELDINDLLAQGEALQKTEKKYNNEVLKNNSDSDADDWEEVGESKPQQGLQLIVEFPKTCKKTKQVDVEMRLKRKINKARKENQINMHKLNLLFCLTYGNYVNRIINDHEILATVLSLIPIKFCSSEAINIKFLEKILAWYKKEYNLEQNIHEDKYQPNDFSLKFKLLEQIRSKTVTANLYFCLIFIIILRSIGWECRLMFNLITLPIKPPTSDLFSLSTKNNQQTDEKSETIKNDENNQFINKKSNDQTLRVDDNDNKISNHFKKDNIMQLDGNNNIDCVKTRKTTRKNNVKISERHGNLSTPNIKTRETKIRSHHTPPKIATVVKNNAAVEINMAIPILTQEDVITSVSGKLNTTQKTPKIVITDEQSLSHGSNEIPIKRITRKRSETINPLMQKINTTNNITVQGKTPRSKSAPGNSEKRSECFENINKDDNEMRKPRYRENRQPKVSPKSTRQRKSQDALSDSGDSSSKNDIWCEVYVNELEVWVAVDIYNTKVNCSEEIYNQATHPVCYIVGWDNNNKVKDLTGRYVPVRVWNTITRKQRIDSEWWEETLRPWAGPKTDREMKEDEQLKNIQLEAPLPKSIAEYKNHPIYALKRHILKYQALYPAEPPILGYVRGEAVYPRNCIYTCGSRETWLKEAKMVRPGEEAYKIVNAKPKFDRLTNKYVIRPLEIFGPWQVEEYVPPAAQNGLVPRNAYGNVELFKPCMLPKGTVHIKLPGVNKLARKLSIDCAPAMTGYDFNRGFTHPIFDGHVVCTEFQDIITKAWIKDQEDQIHRERKKVENRAYGNWKRLIKGLFIRQRLNHKYGFK